MNKQLYETNVPSKCPVRLSSLMNQGSTPDHCNSLSLAEVMGQGRKTKGSNPAPGVSLRKLMGQ